MRFSRFAVHLQLVATHLVLAEARNLEQSRRIHDHTGNSSPTIRQSSLVMVTAGHTRLA